MEKSSKTSLKALTHQNIWNTLILLLFFPGHKQQYGSKAIAVVFKKVTAIIISMTDHVVLIIYNGRSYPPPNQKCIFVTQNVSSPDSCILIFLWPSAFILNFNLSIDIFLPSPKANRYILKAPGLDVKRHKQMCAYGVCDQECWLVGASKHLNIQIFKTHSHSWRSCMKPAQGAATFLLGKLMAMNYLTVTVGKGNKQNCCCGSS